MTLVCTNTHQQNKKKTHERNSRAHARALTSCKSECPIRAFNHARTLILVFVYTNTHVNTNTRTRKHARTRTWTKHASFTRKLTLVYMHERTKTLRYTNQMYPVTQVHRHTLRLSVK